MADIAQAPIRILLATPTIDLPITGHDITGNKATITVGFKRTTRQEGRKLLEAFNNIDEKDVEAEARLVKDHIVHIFGAEVEVQKDMAKKPTGDEAHEPDMQWVKTIIDTRIPECPVSLEDVMTVYFNNSTFYVPLVQGMLSALAPYDYEAAKAKN